MSELGLFRQGAAWPYRGPYEIKTTYHDLRTQIEAKCQFNSFTIVIEHNDEASFVEPREIDDDGIRGGIAEISAVFSGRVDVFNYIYMIGENPEQNFDFGEFFLAQLTNNMTGTSLFDELTRLVKTELKQISKNPLPPVGTP